MSAASQKPYLIRALWDWCNDLGHTPHILVHVDGRTRVPAGYAADGKIVLDVSMDATSGLDLAGDAIQFQARFAGVAHHIYVPYSNVIAIFAAETGQGMPFEVEEAAIEGAAVDVDALDGVEDVPPAEPTPPSSPKASPLKLVK